MVLPKPYTHTGSPKIREKKKPRGREKGEKPRERESPAAEAGGGAYGAGCEWQTELGLELQPLIRSR
jgi:hypothetical protein